MTTKRQNRTYTNEFKEEAVKLVVEQDYLSLMRLNHWVLRQNYFITEKLSLKKSNQAQYYQMTNVVN